MSKMLLAFLFAWFCAFSVYSWISHSTWREKATVLKNIFIGLLTASVAVGTVALFVQLF